MHPVEKSSLVATEVEIHTDASLAESVGVAPITVTRWRKSGELKVEQSGPSSAFTIRKAEIARLKAKKLERVGNAVARLSPDERKTVFELSMSLPVGGSTPAIH